MKQTLLLLFTLLVFDCNSAFSQERLYPVREPGGPPPILTSDRASFVLEKSFEYKLTIGFPSSDDTWFMPNMRAQIVALWLRIQNVSQHAIAVDPAKFTSTDEAGRSYPIVSPEDAFKRIIEGGSGIPIVSKTLRGVSLGRVASEATEDQVREDVLRYSLKAASIPVGSVSEGLIYFEAPPQKKYTINVVLGGLWSKPVVFSNVKPK